MHTQPMARGTTHLFTLIELLVVISIISILASLMMPSLKKALEKARSVSCQNQQKTMGVGFTLYTTDNAGWYPLGPGWYDETHALAEYFGSDQRIVTCPTAANGTYGDPSREWYNNYGCNNLVMSPSVDDWDSRRVSRIQRASDVALLVDAPYVSETYGAWWRIEPTDGPWLPWNQNEATAENPIVVQNAVLESSHISGDPWTALNTIRFRHNGDNDQANALHIDGSSRSYVYGEFRRKNLAVSY